ncbi:hypothetical protein SAMN05443634_11153 [Chishuiella changwenlii]|uniref:Outer membrane protein beta-barrel domain-containing protein n=1 Tax=Chishuiella changwenlii TaxID=1434701 RepID=A0A1M7BMM8_9FLAO|nr:hypothetical protein [Chishuiella changwenlii]GGF02929.1 hypothetical protein GCM10010984_20460 [Chishuiella changwenlii]SHL56177.1 hypothetical protein SAMN05443634_11153 [Chishuiella changwenlii]
MTKILHTIFLVCFGIISFAQTRFEEGYIINNKNERKEVLIKNVDWLNNPQSFEYKLDENSKIETETVNNVKEFGVIGKSIYVSSTVLIDYSSEDIKNLSGDINPEFREETLFLKQLVKGEANLYKYRKGERIRYFFNSTDHPEIEQLVYKMYQPYVNRIDYNKFYRTQILTNFKCASITKNLLGKVEYNDKNLTELFETINNCNNSNVEFVDKAKKNNVKFHLNVRPRVNLNQLTIDKNNFDFQSTKFDRAASFGIGLELELTLPFNNDKWSAIVEPNFVSYKADSERIAPVTDIKSKWSVDYKAIDVVVGIRHYFFLNSQSKIFINGMFVPTFAFNSALTFERNNTTTEIEIGKGFNYGAGIGYTFNKFTGEVRYISDIKRKDDIGNSYNNISFIIGYNLF